MYNIYCDESCHLPNDNSEVMVLGAISCLREEKQQIFDDIRNIKKKYNVSTWNEIKWTKVSLSKIDMYKELIDYFFDNESLSFRALIAKNKSQLDHKKYNNGDYNIWYYKMYFRPDFERYKIREWVFLSPHFSVLSGKNPVCSTRYLNW